MKTADIPEWRHLVQRCPDCDAEIDVDAINIKEGVALCRDCGSLSRLSELRDSDRSVEEILAQPPMGCVSEPSAYQTRLSASLSSTAGFLGAAAFALFWNGVVSFFVMHVLSGLYFNLIGPLPDWFPAAGVENGVPKVNGEPMGMGETLSLCLFLVPFVLVGAGALAMAIIYLVGRIHVVFSDEDSFVSTGVGWMCWKRRFQADQVTEITIVDTPWETNGRVGEMIQLTAERTIKFGSLLTEDRRDWLVVAMKDAVRERR